MSRPCAFPREKARVPRPSAHEHLADGASAPAQMLCSTALVLTNRLAGLLLAAGILWRRGESFLPPAPLCAGAESGAWVRRGESWTRGVLWRFYVEGFGHC